MLKLVLTIELMPGFRNYKNDASQTVNSLLVKLKCQVNSELTIKQSNWLTLELKSIYNFPINLPLSGHLVGLCLGRQNR